VAAVQRAADLGSAGVLVAFDPDHAGLRAAVAAYHLLAPLTGQPQALVVPTGTDPASVLAGHGPAALAAMLANRTRPLADLATGAVVSQRDRWLRHAEGQILALRAAAPLIAALPPAQVARQVARLADRLGLTHAIVTDALPEM